MYAPCGPPTFANMLIGDHQLFAFQYGQLTFRLCFKIIQNARFIRHTSRFFLFLRAPKHTNFSRWFTIFVIISMSLCPWLARKNDILLFKNGNNFFLSLWFVYFGYFSEILRYLTIAVMWHYVGKLRTHCYHPPPTPLAAATWSK